MLAKPRLSLSPDLYPGYRLCRLRGVGGFGEVWEAEKTAGGTVALKFLPCGRGRSANQELRSIQVVQELPHANLIQIDRVWCAGGFLVVAMELADGSLADLLDVYRAELDTALPASHVLPLLTQVARALDFLNHTPRLLNGRAVTVQHCDVTAANLLVFGDRVKLSDFGLTTILGARQKIQDPAGTPAYAAPEVFQGRLTDRTDQYALAVCYCYLRGGRFPFIDTPADFQPDYVRPVPDLTMLPTAERPATARALAPVAHDRWPCCGDFIAELQRVNSMPLVERRKRRIPVRFERRGRSQGTR